MFRVCVIIMALLALLVGRFWWHFSLLQDYKDGQRVAFYTRLTEEPEVRDGRQIFTVFDDQGRRIFITTSLEVLYDYGDKLFIDGVFTKRNERLYFYYPSIQNKFSEHDYLTKIDVYIKDRSKNVFNKYASPTSAGLLLGMVFGGKQGINYDFMEKLRITGVVHVIAASGMNVTLVSGALVSLLSRHMKRQLVLICSIAGVCFYAFLARLEPSIVRATIMVVISLAAGLLGKPYYGLVALFITGYLMLFYRPLLLMDVGFQLSFLSTFGILVIKPLLPFGRSVFMDDVGTTVGAQLMTLPILFGTFGEYGVLSVLVNALVLWTIPYLMVLGALGAICGLVVVNAGGLFVWMSLPLLWFFESVILFFANLGWVLEVKGFSWQVWVGYYFVLAGVFLHLRNRSI